MEQLLERLSKRTWPWTVGAVILVAGFMYWLYAASSTPGSSVVASDTLAGGLPRVSDAVFASAPEQYSRRRVLLSSVKVAERLGRATLALDLPTRPGYPAILDRPVLEQDVGVVPGDNLAIAGSVYVLNDSILTVWAQRGLFDVENREKLEGQTTFFLVDSLELVFPEGGSPEGN